MSYKAMTYNYYGDMYLSLVTGGGSTYELFYDALGRCVERKLNGVASYYLYDGEHWVVEYDGAGAFKSNALYGLGIDEIIARGVNGQAQFPLPDRNGNTAVVTSTMSSGVATILEQYRYDAFGAPTIYNVANPPQVISSSAIGNRFLFTGREYNSQFGFYEYRARAYHPGLGRFMSEDPKGFDAGDYNFYRYCGNDPWDETDPMGLSPGTAVWSGQASGGALEGERATPEPTPGLIWQTGTMIPTRLTMAPVTSQPTAPSPEGTNSNMAIPKTQYGTAAKAGMAGADREYPAVKRDKAHERTGPIGQVVSNGNYVIGAARQGLGVVQDGPYAGKQGSDVKHLNDNLPLGTRLVGYYTVHIYYDKSRLKDPDAPNFKGYWKFDPVIIMKSPGRNENWDRPITSTFP